VPFSAAVADFPSITFWFVAFWLVLHRTLGHRLSDLRSADQTREQKWTTYGIVAESLAMGTVCFVVAWNGRDVPVAAAVAGHLSAGIGTAIVVWGRHTLGRHFSIHLQVDQRHDLVTDGPYRWVRHPIYSGDILFHAGVPLLCGAWEALVFPVIYAALAVVRLRKEEVMLGDAYAGYAEYRTRTSALVPGLY